MLKRSIFSAGASVCLPASTAPLIDPSSSTQPGTVCLHSWTEQLLYTMTVQAWSAVRRCNNRLPVNRLPDDVLLLIWQHLAFGDRIAISHVSYSWRLLALSLKPLWAEIHINSWWAPRRGYYGEYLTDEYMAAPIIENHDPEEEEDWEALKTCDCVDAPNCDCDAWPECDCPRLVPEEGPVTQPHSNIAALEPLFVRSDPMLVSLHLKFKAARVPDDTISTLQKSLHMHQHRLTMLTVSSPNHESWLPCLHDMPLSFLSTLTLSLDDRCSSEDVNSDMEQYAWERQNPDLTPIESVFPVHGNQPRYTALKHLQLPCRFSRSIRYLSDVQSLSCVVRDCNEFRAIFESFPKLEALVVDLSMCDTSDIPLTASNSRPRLLTSLHLNGVQDAWTPTVSENAGLKSSAIRAVYVNYDWIPSPTALLLLADVCNAATICYRSLEERCVSLEIDDDRAFLRRITCTQRLLFQEDHTFQTIIQRTRDHISTENLRAVDVDIHRWNSLLNDVSLFRQLSAPRLESLTVWVDATSWPTDMTFSVPLNASLPCTLSTLTFSRTAKAVGVLVVACDDVVKFLDMLPARVQTLRIVGLEVEEHCLPVLAAKVQLLKMVSS